MIEIPYLWNAMDSGIEYIDLLTLQCNIKAALEGTFRQSVWVKAEISSLKVASVGHCYLELSQNGPRGVTAKCRATIWSSRYYTISQHFRSVTGSPLAVGQEILALCQVSYHEIYGLSINITDVNPEFTLGAGEALRRQTIERLRREGLMDVQKRLRLGALPYRLAVVSAETAAGYGDFRRHLLENEYGFAYDPVLFPATMQGKDAPASIVAAMRSVESSPLPFDALLILRGGGSDLDLACFDDYSLAVAIARFPIPVFTAIGHDRDNHVADMVANTSVKTPTALADLFVDATAREDERISSVENRLRVAFSSRIEACDALVLSLEQRITGGANALLEKENHALEMLSRTMSSYLMNRLVTLNYKVSNYESTIRSKVDSKLLTSDSDFEKTRRRISHAAALRLSAGENEVNMLETRIVMSDPRNILKKGYSMVLDSKGVKISSTGGRVPGDKISVMMPDGRMYCTVDEIKRETN